MQGTCKLDWRLCLAIGVAACACVDNELGKRELVLEPQLVDFGEVPVGDSSVRVLNLANEGETAIAIARVALVVDTAELEIASELPAMIGAHEDIDIVVAYAPIDAGEDRGSIEIEPSGGGVQTIMLHGAGVARGVRITPITPIGERCGEVEGSLSFGAVAPTQTKDAILELANDGPTPIRVMSVALASGSSRELSIDAVALRTMVAPREKIELVAHYTPIDRGADAGELVVTIDQPRESTLRVPLCGTGVAAAVCTRPTPLDFGLVELGSDDTATLRIESCGELPLEIAGQLANDAEHPSDPSFTSPFVRRLTIEPGQRFDLEIAFHASNLGLRTGWIAITSNAFAAPIAYAPIIATGAKACDFVLSPAQLTWRSAGQQGVSIANHGASTCTVDRLEIAAGRGYFRLTGAPPAPFALASTASIIVAVDYLPSMFGQDIGALELDENGVTHRVDLFGNAPSSSDCEFEVVPAFLDFGLVSIGDTRMLSVEAHKRGGGTCVVQAASIDASSDPAFSSTGNPFGTVLTNVPLIVPVAFHPAALGAASGILHVDTNDPETPTIDVPLIGTATTARVCVEPQRIDFGTKLLGSSSTIDFTISACGADTVDIQSIDFTLGATDIAIDNPLGSIITLLPGMSRVVTVRYTPADAGSDHAIIAVKSDNVVNPSIDIEVDGNAVHQATEPVYINSPTTLFSFDPTTNALTLIAGFSPQPALEMSDIAINLDGEMFGVTVGGEIFRIDPITGAITFVFYAGMQTAGLTCLSDGTLVVAGDSVKLLDPQSGQLIRELVPAGLFDTSGDILALPDGQLYWTIERANDAIVRIDPISGATTRLAPIGFTHVYGLAYANDELYGFGLGGDVLRIDAQTGTATQAISIGGPWYGATSNPVSW